MNQLQGFGHKTVSHCEIFNIVEQRQTVAQPRNSWLFVDPSTRPPTSHEFVAETYLKQL